jgi:hypothetical protein
LFISFSFLYDEKRNQDLPKLNNAIIAKTEKEKESESKTEKDYIQNLSVLNKSCLKTEDENCLLKSMEKGSLYKGMISNLNDFTLLEKSF